MLSFVLAIVLFASSATAWPTLFKLLDQSTPQLPQPKDAEEIPGWLDPREGGGRMLDVSLLYLMVNRHKCCTVNCSGRLAAATGNLSMSLSRVVPTLAY